MLHHLLTLTWKRKSRNLMLSLEILIAFAIVFAIAAAGLRYWQLYRMPIGFDGADTWAITLLTDARGPDAIPADVYERFRHDLLDLPGVRAVGFLTHTPYTLSTWTTDYRSAQTGARVHADTMEASDGAAAALGIKLAEGRWFSGEDDGQAVEPAVLNRRAAATLFPGRPALGQRFTEPSKEHAPRTFKVVGLVDDFRNKGPLMVPTGFVLTRFAPYANKSRPDTIVIKLAPGTPRAFEATLNERLKRVRNDWSYGIEPLRTTRASLLKAQVTPLVILGVVAAFMLAMVAFGLFGVLWQNTTRRIPEIGLRRAIGASAGQIYGQIVAEQLLLSSLAMAVGLLLLVQLPVTGVFGEHLNWTVFVGAAWLSMAVIYLLSLLCALYPGWRASRLDPTAALHYE
jgi:putative ABC transport system permease protein